MAVEHSLLAPADVPPARIPGPPGLPLLGNLLDMGRDTLGFFERSVREYGDLTALRVGTFPAVIVNNSDMIEQVLVKQHEKFTKNKVFWRQVQAMVGNGLFVSEGKFWQRQRKLAAPAFATLPLQSYAPAMVDQAERTVARWQDGDVIDIYREMMGLGLRIAAQTLFDSNLDDDLDGIEQATNWIIDEVAARFSRPFLIPDAVPLPGHVRYRRGVAYIDRLVYRIIAEYRAGKRAHEGGFLDRLMQARDDDGKPMSDKQLRDEICNMLLAGYETSALTMSYGFDLLGRHRDIQDEVAEEAQRVAGDRPVTSDDIGNLPRTEHAIIEILRLFPPGWAIGRENTEDVWLGDYRIARGTTIILSPWITQRDPRYFADPLKFHPERWAGDFRRRLPRFAYFPFGGGPRVCIGNRFAMMEAMLLLATIVKRFDVERLTGRPFGLLPSVTLRPKGGIWVKLNARH